MTQNKITKEGSATEFRYRFWVVSAWAKLVSGVVLDELVSGGGVVE